MWHLTNIQAKNICAFQDLNYDIRQNCTTLIFGQNKDNDSQGSNGSGKSALLETIAIALTGETLRKVKMEEIINDAEDNAQICATLQNDSNKTQMHIIRHLSRKAAQEISIGIIDEQGHTEPVEQATVADYNKYVLEAIGLSKDDIFTNFVLSKHKYTSFLSSSDKEKKELINRFSNGNMIDESIAAVQADIAPVEEQLREDEKELSRCDGQIQALTTQIAETQDSIRDNADSRKKRIEHLKEEIAKERQSIREYDQRIYETEEFIIKLDKCYNQLVEIDGDGELNSDNTVKQLEKKIVSLLGKVNLTLKTDYSQVIADNLESLKQLEKEQKSLLRDKNAQQKRVESAKAAYEKTNERFGKFEEGLMDKRKKLVDNMHKFQESIKKIETENKNLDQQFNQLNKEVAELNNILAGVIECPKCHHHFHLDPKVGNVEDIKPMIQDRQGEIKDICITIANNRQEIRDINTKEQGEHDKQHKLEEEKTEWYIKVSSAQDEVNDASRILSDISLRFDEVEHKINKLQMSVNSTRERMLDEAFALVDEATDTNERVSKNYEIFINSAKGTISSHEETIKTIENTSESDVIDRMKKNLEQYKKDFSKAEKAYNDSNAQLTKLKTQETVFVEFKSHLANTKIEALSNITNEFLEEIGSDIRVEFSGFTLLKSGKIREKISISLVRDGVDCGSFDKFSEGEKARVNLANILAMHKLTNMNCDEGKGLDLLVLDEILEATDEQGLTNIFNALNHIGITSMVVSHGNIAENYPYRTVIQKLNGISKII